MHRKHEGRNGWLKGAIASCLISLPAILLLLYYWMCTLEGYDPVFRYIHGVTLILAGAVVLA